MTKRVKSDDEGEREEEKEKEKEEVSVHESADEGTPPAKKSKIEGKTEKQKKATKTKDAQKESSSSGGKGKKGSVAKNVFTNSEGDQFVDLGKKRRVTVRSFKGTTFVDIREFYGQDDDLKPGKKGISLSAEQWEELKSNVGTINSLIKKL